MKIDYIKQWKISIPLLSPKGLDPSSSEVITIMSFLSIFLEFIMHIQAT